MHEKHNGLNRGAEDQIDNMETVSCYTEYR